MYQFSTLLSEIGKMVSWDTQMAGISVGVKPDMEYHPLSPSGDRLKESRRKGQGSLSKFVSNLNKGR